MKAWIDEQLKKNNNRPILRLFLTGLKGQLTQTSSKPYGYYPKLISAALSLCFAKWLTDLYTS